MTAAGLALAGLGIAWAAVAARKRPLVLMLGLVLPLLAFAVITGVSLFRPVMLLRTLLFLPVPLTLLLGTALAQIAMLELRTMAIGLAAGFEFLAIFLHAPRYAKETWRDIVPFVAGQHGAADVVVFLSPEALLAFERYWPDGFPTTRCAVLVPPDGLPPGRMNDDCLYIEYPEVQRALGAGVPFWLVARWNKVPLLMALDDELARGFTVQSQRWDSNNGASDDGTVMVARVARPQ